MEIEKRKQTQIMKQIPTINSISTLIDLIIDTNSDLFDWYWFLLVDKVWYYKQRSSRQFEIKSMEDSFLESYRTKIPNARMILFIPLVKFIVLDGNYCIDRYDIEFNTEFATINDEAIGTIMSSYKMKKRKSTWR